MKGKHLLTLLTIGLPVWASAQDAVTSTPPLEFCDTKEAFVLKDDAVDRIITTGRGSDLYFKAPLLSESVKVTETWRKSRIREDLDLLFKAIKDDQIKSQGLEKCFAYEQKYKRATLDIEVSDGKDVIRKKHLVIGPAEHLYLSADMPVTDIKQLSYDEATHQVVEKEKPATVYLGVNWMLGDVFAPVEWNSHWWQRLSLKGMAKVSKHPGESLGAGVGLNLGVVEVFAAHLWTKDDPAVSGPNLGTTESTALGVSFNISRGIGWFSGE